jgi:hypothetical protein
MTNVIDAGVQWLAYGVAGVFLMVCVWHNRRTGYQSVRSEKISLSEAMALFKRSLTSGDHAVLVAGQESMPSIRGSQTEQLLSLNSALGSGWPASPCPVSERQPSELEEPLHADALHEGSAVEK